MPHQDGPLYFPVVAILSLGAPTLMKFMPHSKFATSIKKRIYLSANSNSDTETVLPCQLPEFHDVDSFNTISRRKENFHPSTVKDVTYTSVEPLSGLPSSTNLLRSKGREQCLENDTEAALQHEHTNTVSVALMPRSLLIFKDNAYQDFLHGIDECDEHILDGKVANLSSLCHKAYSCSVQSSDPRELSSAHGLDPKDTDIGHNLLENQGKTYQRSFLKQTGTRVSLTCRYVPKSFSRFIRL
ncbi:hypothetical protein O6H91_17G049300 [Diphasiastrum complanatum]|nr:hypothetical protein O6H91_17G049300 [Diphasiastrum complanatum]